MKLLTCHPQRLEITFPYSCKIIYYSEKLKLSKYFLQSIKLKLSITNIDFITFVSKLVFGSPRDPSCMRDIIVKNETQIWDKLNDNLFTISLTNVVQTLQKHDRMKSCFLEYVISLL